jgi:hypothetical protein
VRKLACAFLKSNAENLLNDLKKQQQAAALQGSKPCGI